MISGLLEKVGQSMKQSAKQMCDPKYEIRVQGRLSERWSDWLEGSTIHWGQDDREGLVTTLQVTAVDQAALHGILSRIRDLNLRLISVHQIGTQKGEG